MSLYTALFGENPGSDIILATLGLTRDDVGRFRDAYVAEGKIAVYTRNGGGNRQCWHADDPDYGDARCKNEPYEKTIREMERRPGRPSECGCEGRTTHLGREVTHDHPTGRDIVETWHRCLSPDSPDCRCIGCFMTYHVHELPNYSHDRDDKFDSTYATIYFDFPPEYSDGLKALDSGEKWNPDDRWMAMLDAIKERPR